MKGFGLLLAATSLLPAQDLILRRANVIDGVSLQPLRNTTVTIRAGRIEAVTPGEVPAPPEATVIDLKGRWVLPGYIDTHVHLSDLRSARAALASGVTTARSMGTSRYTDVSLRDLHRAGAADLPDVIPSGYHVRPHPAEELFLDFPKLVEFRKGFLGAAQVRRLVRANLDRGAGVIKTMATERAGLPDTDPRKRVFTEEELVAIVEEARAAGIAVAAHAHGDEGAAAAVRAGVRSIEHGTYLSEETLGMMKARGTYLVPTIATVVDLIEPGGDYDNATLTIRGRAMLPRVRGTASRAWKMGVKLVAGTDTGYGPNSIRRIPHEILELAAIGMPAMDAIKAGTSVAAECLGIADRTGSIRKGLEADLIVVDGDPLADLSALQDVLVVINDGVIAVNRLN